MSVAEIRPAAGAGAPTLEHALQEIAAGAAERDRRPGFPGEAFAALARAGALRATLPDGQRHPAGFASELGLVRAVARADGSVGRIFDGHVNAVERLAQFDELSEPDRAAVAAGELLLGVWGADPAPDGSEGAPAQIGSAAGGSVLSGVKTFCSGAGGVHRALVVAQDGAGQRVLAYVDLARGVHVDRSWFQGSGLRASESHRVVFESAPVIAILGGPNELAREPWFSRDALRTSATWAGIAECAVTATEAFLRDRGRAGDLEGLAVARLRMNLATIDRWLDHAALLADAGRPLSEASVLGRGAISAACRAILEESANVCGTRALVTGGPLSRARRDLDLFLLQHRLDPLLARTGRAALEGEGRA